MVAPGALEHLGVGGFVDQRVTRRRRLCGQLSAGGQFGSRQRFLGQRKQVGLRHAGGDRIAHVPLQRQAANLDDGAPNAVFAQRLDDGSRVLPARFIVVRQHDDACLQQRFAVLVAPLAGATRITGGHQAECLESVDVLLAFDHEHKLAVLGDRKNLVVPVEHPLDTV